MSEPSRRVALIILDGWGHGADQEHNAIVQARTPTWDKLWEEAPHTLINSCGEAVGLPAGQIGNSEVGHMNIGAGRVVYQDFTRINRAIDNGSFFREPVFLDALKALPSGRSVHILGLLSPGGVHSHERQIQALVDLAHQQNIQNVYLHAFLDGRDVTPRSAQASLEALHDVDIVSMVGRYYAMDRDNRWERVQRAYDLLTLGKADYQAMTPVEGLLQAYARDESDEFVQPTAIHRPGQAPVTIEDGDVIFFMNFRADRARALSYALTQPDFDGFERERVVKTSEFVTLTPYADDLAAKVAYPAASLPNTLGEYIADLGLPQFRVAETEKYAHVTFFFNGGVEQPYEGEERVLVPSPRVPTYDLQPEMSAEQVTQHLCEAITSQKYPLIVCNYANPDMLGHTGHFSAARQAVEVIDKQLRQIIQAAEASGCELLITADHGNVECMYDPQTAQPHTAHTTSLVPLVYVGDRKLRFSDEPGALPDIAPTLLYLLGKPAPAEMTGRALLSEK